MTSTDPGVAYPHRFRVRFVTTRSRERLRHILDAASELVRNVRRSLIYGVYLPDYLDQPDGLSSLCFRDHRHQPVSLLPDKPAKTPKHSRRIM